MVETSQKMCNKKDCRQDTCFHTTSCVVKLNHIKFRIFCCLHEFLYLLSPLPLQSRMCLILPVIVPTDRLAHFALYSALYTMHSVLWTMYSIKVTIAKKNFKQNAHSHCVLQILLCTALCTINSTFCSLQQKQEHNLQHKTWLCIFKEFP